MLETIWLNPLKQTTQKITNLLNQLTQDYQQLLEQDKTLPLKPFPLNEQNFSVLEEIDLLTTDLRGYASQIVFNQQIQNPDQTLITLQTIQLFENPSLAELYFAKNKQFPLFYQYLQKLDYLRLLLIDWLILKIND
ncbi:MAG: hypothetical protein ACK58N_00435 [Synechocystis sp.]|jgi:hypothetical protein